MYEACRPADSQDGFPPYYDQSDGVQQFNIIDGAAPVLLSWRIWRRHSSQNGAAAWARHPLQPNRPAAPQAHHSAGGAIGSHSMPSSNCFFLLGFCFPVSLEIASEIAGCVMPSSLAMRDWVHPRRRRLRTIWPLTNGVSPVASYLASRSMWWLIGERKAYYQFC
jgi:hypothetical protein